MDTHQIAGLAIAGFAAGWAFCFITFKGDMKRFIDLTNADTLLWRRRTEERYRSSYEQAEAELRQITSSIETKRAYDADIAARMSRYALKKAA